MPARAMRVPMDHAPHVSGTERPRHRLRVHIHDGGHGARDMTPAAGAHLIGQELAVRERQREEAPLPEAGAHDAA